MDGIEYLWFSNLLSFVRIRLLFGMNGHNLSLGEILSILGRQYFIFETVPFTHPILGCAPTITAILAGGIPEILRVNYSP